MEWYKIIAKRCHIESGKNRDQVIYLWAENAIHALNKYKKLGGVPRSKVPSIECLDQNEKSRLEKIIVKENISLRKAKK